MVRETHADDIVGLHLKCSKGQWSIDDEKIDDIGKDGFRFTALPATARWGRIKWVDGLPVDKVTQLYSDGYPDWEELPPGWEAYTGMQGLTLGEEVLTFTSAFGARKTIKNLLGQYDFRRGRQLPVCTLGTRPRNDEFGNVDPVLRIASWTNPSDFADILPPELIDALAIESKSLSAREAAPAEIAYQGAEINDDIPF